ncbi:hypothetical protein ACVWXN_008527 [Bradyrhizobium sp. i1.4.4]
MERSSEHSCICVDQCRTRTFLVLGRLDFSRLLGGMTWLGKHACLSWLVDG